MSVIEREIVIEAPPRVVWQVITQPQHISEWFSDQAEIDLRPGGPGTLVFQHRATKDLTEPVDVGIVVETFEPPHRFSFRWAHPAGAEPRADNSLLVEFTLIPEGEHTRLRLVESGYDQVDWPRERTRDTIDDHEKGWDIHLARLDAYARERSASA